jgi:aryl-alcohol dehydrogenase-like predicted oxidoreductase
MEYPNHKDLSLSEIGVGCYALIGVYGSKDVDNFQVMLRRAYELGVNFIDCIRDIGL